MESTGGPKIAVADETATGWMIYSYVVPKDRRAPDVADKKTDLLSRYGVLTAIKVRELMHFLTPIMMVFRSVRGKRRQ
jgi:hypothetical protein